MLEHLLTTRAYWAGTWLDLWSIPHALFGLMLAIGAALIGVTWGEGFGATATLALLWEVFERLSGVGATEAPTNSLADIVLALAGFVLGSLLLKRVKNRDAQRILLVIAGIIWATVNFLGWLAYQHYAGILS